MARDIFKPGMALLDAAKRLSAKTHCPLMSNLYMLEHFIGEKENRAQVLKAAVQHVYVTSAIHACHETGREPTNAAAVLHRSSPQPKSHQLQAGFRREQPLPHKDEIGRGALGGRHTLEAGSVVENEDVREALPHPIFAAGPTYCC